MEQKENFIAFSINSISLGMSISPPCECADEALKLITCFDKNHKSYILKVEDLQPFQSSEGARRYLGVELWNQLSDIPCASGIDGHIEDDFYVFINGTSVSEIWHWFESEFGMTIASQLYGV